MTKSEIRAQILAERRSHGAHELGNWSRDILEQILLSDWYLKSHSIMSYVSFDNEVDTLKLINRALSDGKHICVPLIANGDIVPCAITNLGELVTGRFNLLEPAVPAPVDPKGLELVVVPGIAFSREGDRIGFGKGYYDRFLPKTTAKRLALCYAFQLLDTIPAQYYDCKMDAILTQCQHYFFSR